MKIRLRIAFSFIGDTLLLFSLAFLPGMFLSLIKNDDPIPFIIPFIITVFLGFLLRNLSRDKGIKVREAFLIVSLAWIIISILGSLPYILSGEGVLGDPVNALFESMSGFTTTGASVIADYTRYSIPIMFWRQFTQWIGGMGIIVLAIAILPRLRIGGSQLMQLESPGPQLQKLTPHIMHNARIFWMIYISFTLLETAILSILHYTGQAPIMDPYNALLHSFTTMSTGGFSPFPESIGAFSPAVQWVIIIFMIIAGTNFALFWYLFIRDYRIFRNEEFRWYIILLFSLSLILTLLIGNNGNNAFSDTFRTSLFQVASIMTTTGYSTVDFSKWPSTAQYLLFIAMLIGGCSGSTAGSIKVIRWIIGFKAFLREMLSSIYPGSIRVIRLGGKPVNERIISSVLSFITIYFVILAIGAFIIMIDSSIHGINISLITGLTASAATLGNIGPGLGSVGPISNYGFFPPLSKLVMFFLMLIGRLEVFTVIVLFTRSYWRD